MFYFLILRILKSEQSFILPHTDVFSLSLLKYFTLKKKITLATFLFAFYGFQNRYAQNCNLMYNFKECFYFSLLTGLAIEYL